MHDPEEVQVLNVKKGQTKLWSVHKLYALFNPRRFCETVLAAKNLLAKIVAAGGITQAIEIYLPDEKLWAEEEVHNPFDNKVVNTATLQLDSLGILMRGHCRVWCALYIIEHPKEFSDELIAKMKKLQVITYTGDLSEMKRFALDDGEKTNLFTWNVVAHVLQCRREGRELKAITLDNPRWYYQHLLTKGPVIYSEIAREPDGKTRVKAIIKGLRNPMETHIDFPFQAGRNAFANQLELWWKIRNDGRPSTDEEKNALILDMRYSIVSDLRILYNKCKASDLGWRPLVRIERVSQIVEGEHISFCVVPKDPDQFFLVEGGHPDFRQALLKNACQVNDPKPAAKKIAPLSKSAINEVLNALESKACRAIAEYVGHSDNSKNAQGDNWGALDHKTAALEAVQDRLKELKNLHPMLQALVDSITETKTSSKAADNAEKAVFELNEVVKVAEASLIT